MKAGAKRASAAQRDAGRPGTDEREQGRLAGKRYSRVRIVGRGWGWFSVGPDGRLSDEQVEYLKRLRGDESTDDYTELLKEIKAEAAKAAETLRQRGLPGTPNVLFLREGDGWSDDAFEFDCEPYMASVKAGWKPGSVDMVDQYLTEYKKIDPDSPEGLAARVLVWSQLLETRGPRTKDAVVAAFRLGELSALDRVYSIDRQHARKPKPKRQAEKWREFTWSLIRQDPGRSAEHYWESLTDEIREHGSADISCDGETLVWSEGGKVTPIRFRTFRRYVEDARSRMVKTRTHKASKELAS